MADKIPVKANFTGADVTSLGEFEPGDTTPVANGGTGATTASDARTNLGAAALAGSASQSFAMLNGTVAGTLSLTGASSTLGYGVGAGGTVTQATSKSTAVTLNKPCGRITMNNAALAANTTVTFLVNNSLCGNGDVVNVGHVLNAGTNAAYLVWVQPGSGGFNVNIRNISSGSLSEEVVLDFAIIKGATS